MDVKGVLIAMRKSAGYDVTEVVEKLGWTRSALTNKYAQNDIKVNNLAKYADVCGYDLVLRPKRLGAAHMEGCIVIAPEEDDDDV